MKVLPIVLLVAWLCSSCDRTEPLRQEEEPAIDVADRVSRDGEEIFKRAFWRRPSDDDEIIRAERREWLSGGEVERWEWYLQFRPGDELGEMLFGRNEFRLSPTAQEDHSVAHGPDWFTPGAGEVALAAEDGSMTLVRDGQTVFAMGAGGGFSSGHELSPSTVQPVPPSQGRLPGHRPPAD
ncbi:MAG: hypothetical protein Q7Q71_06140 [Verrucomicrobiota bacterium JB023]|nr:hypothetical protein [Verrucomicrobiota bacterium JB023]